MKVSVELKTGSPHKNLTLARTEVRGQLHTPVTLLFGKEPPVSNEQYEQLAPEHI
jgi:hypothetical protein